MNLPSLDSFRKGRRAPRITFLLRSVGARKTLSPVLSSLACLMTPLSKTWAVAVVVGDIFFWRRLVLGGMCGDIGGGGGEEEVVVD